jgi:hypothetical protein
MGCGLHSRAKVFCLVRQVMLWQAVSEPHARECPDEESGQDDKRDDQGIIHGRGSLDNATGNKRGAARQDPASLTDLAARNWFFYAPISALP